MDKKILREHHKNVKDVILKRLSEFSEVSKKGEREIFREMCFCLLTAGASAELGIKTIEYLGDIIFIGTEEEIVSKLKEVYRFYNIRGNYIFLARESFRNINWDLSGIELRDNIVQNVKGLSYKEASHFLRNIGYKGYAILDKHIIGLMFKLGLVSFNRPPKNRQEYLELEEIFRAFSKEIGIDFDELDLVLWSYKTGEVLK